MGRVLREGWEVRKLGEVCEYDKTSNKRDDLLYVGLEDIQSNTGIFIGLFEPKSVKSLTFYFNDEHVLYGRLRPYLNKVLLPDFEGHCSTEIFPIKPKKNILDRRFLFQWLIATETMKKINETWTGATLPRANMNAVLEFEINLPPLPEQQKIVAILDEAFGAIEKAKANAKRNLTHAKELFESYLQSVFENKGEGWEEKTLGEIAIVKSGGTPSRSKKEYWEGNIAWYSSGELNDLFTQEPERYINDLAIKNSSAKLFPIGSLLIGMYDTAALKMSIIDRDASFNQAIAGVEPNKSINLIFILHSINSIKPEILNLRRGVRQKNLNLSKIKDIPIFLPPITEQQAIVKKLDTLSEQTKALEKIYQQKINDLDELKKSILRKAFNGELT